MDEFKSCEQCGAENVGAEVICTACVVAADLRDGA